MSLAKKNQTEVGSLSRLIILQSVSTRLPRGLRFFRSPLPAKPTAIFASRLPSQAARRAYPVPPLIRSWLDPSSMPTALLSTMVYNPSTIQAVYLLVQAYQHLRLGPYDDISTGSSHVLVVPLIPSPSPPDAGSFRRSSKFGVPVTGGYIVPEASHRAVASTACSGREPLVE